MPVFAIAYNTILESVRKLELVLFLLLGTSLIISICYLSTNSQALEIITKFLGEQSYVTVSSPGGVWDTPDMIQRNILSYMKASGMFFNEIFTLIIAFSLTLFMLPGEITSGAILYILPKPVDRYQYILGKFLGVFAIVSSCWLIMGLELFAFFSIKESAIDMYLVSAIFLLPLKYAIFIGFMIALTSRLPAIFAGIISLLLFLGGHVSSKLQDFYLDPDLALEGPAKYLIQMTYYLIPHLHPVFSGTIMDPNENVLETWNKVASWAGYAILYTCVLLIIAIISFRRKSL